MYRSANNPNTRYFRRDYRKINISENKKEMIEDVIEIEQENTAQEDPRSEKISFIQTIKKGKPF